MVDPFVHSSRVEQDFLGVDDVIGPRFPRNSGRLISIPWSCIVGYESKFSQFGKAFRGQMMRERDNARLAKRLMLCERVGPGT